MVAELQTVDGEAGFRWGPAKVDEAGYRDYKVDFIVECTDRKDGPAIAMQAPGLPVIGSVYQFGNDFDDWVWCRPEMDCSPLDTEGDNTCFKLTYTFSNKPLDYKIQRCWDNPSIQDPTLEPPKISGSSHKDKEEATHDRFLQKITNSSLEPITGKSVEFETSYSTVDIEKNVYLLNLNLIDLMMDTVNAYPLWDYPPRCVKLSGRKFQRKFYGICSIYFAVTLHFEVKIKYDPVTGTTYSGWDRWIMDEGTRVLFGHWDTATGLYLADPINGAPPNPENPAHFIRYKDPQGGSTKALLDGAGMPLQNAPPLVIGANLASVTVTDGGTGYTSAPAVTFANQAGVTTGQGATGIAIITSGAVTSVQLTNFGYGYNQAIPPNVVFSGGAGSGAKATAVVNAPANCEQCPSSFPLYWQINGFTPETGTQFPRATFNIPLTWVDHCTWKGICRAPDDNLAIILQVLGTVDQTLVWRVSINDLAGNLFYQDVWQLATDQWSCRGPNTLLETKGRYPPITLTGGGASEPVFFLTEYYQESDFTELGYLVPEVIENPDAF